MSNLLKYLNKEQKQAVLVNDRPLLIMAGAGSGKTRVLTTKIAYAIEQKMVSEFEVLAFTFTNKAAKEMKERVSDLLNKDVSHMWIGTFHSICSRILRREIDYLGYNSNFTIYDTQDSRNLIKDIMKRLKVDEKVLASRTVVAKISDYKNRFVSADEVISESFYPRERLIGDIYKEYERAKKKNNALDFDDLILLTIRLFEEVSEVADKYQDIFQYVFVDEYQDTNHAQYRLIRLLTQRNNRICVVGDSDQSIYSWRGADISNIMNFEADYKDAKIILLEQNYRSTQNILDTANLLIQNNPDRHDKNLWTDNRQGDDVWYQKYNDEREEANAVVNMIYQMNDDGIAFDEMAILYRTNAQSRAFEEKLMYEGLPHKVVGGLKFYERKEVKDIISYLYFVANPDDDLSFKRIINTPKRGIGQASVDKLERFAIRTNQSMFDAMDDEALSKDLGAGPIKRLKDAYDLFTKFMQDALELTLTDFVKAIFEKSGYHKMLLDSKLVEDKSRIENIESLINAVSDFEQDNPEAGLNEYLQGVSLLSDVDKTSTDKAISLMTIHAAKGLEYDVVFLAGMEEGLFPSKMSMEEGNLEEERRLAYVAITRAKKRLFISSVDNRRTYGQMMRSMPSRFIEEISEQIVDKTQKADIDIRDSFFDYDSFETRKQQIRQQLKPKIQAMKEADGGWDYRVGDRVRHKKFGEGMIVQVKDLERGKELVVSFNRVGIKRLASQMAPLERI